jgi:hypothetical protein
MEKSDRVWVSFRSPRKLEGSVVNDTTNNNYYFLYKLIEKNDKAHTFFAYGYNRYSKKNRDLNVVLISGGPYVILNSSYKKRLAITALFGERL